VHLVGFITITYHDARSSECQILYDKFLKQRHFTLKYDFLVLSDHLTTLPVIQIRYSVEQKDGTKAEIGKGVKGSTHGQIEANGPTPTFS